MVGMACVCGPLTEAPREEQCDTTETADGPSTFALSSLSFADVS